MNEYFTKRNSNWCAVNLGNLSFTLLSLSLSLSLYLLVKEEVEFTVVVDDDTVSLLPLGSYAHIWRKRGGGGERRERGGRELITSNQVHSHMWYSTRDSQTSFQWEEQGIPVYKNYLLETNDIYIDVHVKLFKTDIKD